MSIGIELDRRAGLATGTGKVEKRSVPFAAPLFNLMSSYGGAATIGFTTEEITLNTGGTTTDTSASFIPANSFIIGVTSRVTETITTAANYILGDASDTNRFLTTNTDITAGDTAVGLAHYAAGTEAQGTASAMRITTNVNPGAGKILVTIYYATLTPPTTSPA